MPSFDLLIIFIVGLLAGTFGTLVGAGTMLTMPLMIFLGIPPLETIAANRVGVLGLSSSGYYEFQKKKLVNYKISFIIMIFSTIGAYFGAKVVLNVNEALLEKLIGIIMLIVLIVTILNKNRGLKNTAKKGKRYYFTGILSSLAVGFYFGFIGLAAGLFLIYLTIFVFGQTFLQSAATIKIPGFVASLIAVIVFWLNGKIIWSVSIALFISMFIGSYFGAHYSEKIGNIWIRRLFLLAAAVMALRLLV